MTAASISSSAGAGNGGSDGTAGGIQECGALCLAAEFGHQIIQVRFLQLLDHVIHGRIVVGEDGDRFVAQQDVGNDIEDGLGLAGTGRTFDHADLRTEGLLTASI
jgi:hypothetical protein